MIGRVLGRYFFFLFSLSLALSFSLSFLLLFAIARLDVCLLGGCDALRSERRVLSFNLLLAR